jgi:hypothetical protein
VHGEQAVEHCGAIRQRIATAISSADKAAAKGSRTTRKSKAVAMYIRPNCL